MILREELYRLVWAEPMTKIAARFEVSGSYLARVCETLAVPRPPRGHWAKLAVGKAASAPPLPEPKAGAALGWSRDDTPVPRVKPALPKTPVRRAAARPSLPAMHPLLSGAKAMILHSRPVDEGALLRPFKRRLADITTSQSCLDRALLLANALFNGFEAAGHHVALAPANSDAWLYRYLISCQHATSQGIARQMPTSPPQPGAIISLFAPMPSAVEQQHLHGIRFAPQTQPFDD